MTDAVFVKPYPGLILPDVPRSGTHIPKALAESWIANGLVVQVHVPSQPAIPTPTALRKGKR
jgi:hypothetical protein